MTLPGSIVTIGERVAAALAAPSTTNGFIVGFTERGRTDGPDLVLSLADFAQKCGERLSGNPEVYDAVDVAFREGASAIYIGSIVGPAVATAQEDLLDADDDPTLRVTARSPGDWGNDIDVACVLTGGDFVLTVSYLDSVVEASPSLANNTEAVQWAEQSSNYIRLEDLSTEYEPTTDPKTQDIALAGGDRDHSNATTTEFDAALDLFAGDLGPGLVAAPGFPTSDAYESLLNHAGSKNRRALLDGVDTANEGTLVAASTALRGLEGLVGRFGKFCAPHAVVPGLSLSTTREVPYSAVELGRTARAEAEGKNPNVAAAGKNGGARYATGLTQSFTDAQREALSDAGVSVAILRRGTPVMMGDRTLTNPLTDGDWKSFANSRLVMAAAAAAGVVLEDYQFEQIDGRGYIFSKLHGDLTGAMMPFYLANALFGQTPEEAFQINTGPDLNTPQTIAAQEIHAQIALRVSPSGEVLTTEIVKVPTTEALL